MTDRPDDYDPENLYRDTLRLPTFDDWLEEGLRRGWVGPPSCVAHGLPYPPKIDGCVFALVLTEPEPPQPY